MTMNMSLTSS